MNIKEAKTEIINTLHAYLKKDEKGRYTYPLHRQRPILLMGPPGIGKTAIMEQIAGECGIGLVAYTITHHTRQSAVGLPKIVSRTYGGVKTDVTEYTMSEIIASVYDCIEKTGKKEGILFIDEINCVSETLAPTMLQFLQNKTFGSHKVPQGWLIAAAGNPPEYNKSVREFDIVTLDRVRKIDIIEDCDVWLEYAWERQVHGAVLSYLKTKKENFYVVENTVDGKLFVTARGWEDLSQLLKGYEELGVEITKDQVSQFLQKEEAARDFTAYYRLYCKYGTDYGIGEIISGELAKAEYDQKLEMAGAGAFEERYIVCGLLLSALNTALCRFEAEDERTVKLHEKLKQFQYFLSERESMECLGEFLDMQRKSLEIRFENELLSLEELQREEELQEILEKYWLELRKNHSMDKTEGFSLLKALFEEEVSSREKLLAKTKENMENAFRFMEAAFGDGQEMVLFVTTLTGNHRAAAFLSAHGCEGYFRHCDVLLYRKQEEALLQECREAQLW